MESMICYEILRYKQKNLDFRLGNLLPTQLCRAATAKPRQIERSSFFLLNHNDKTRIYRMVSDLFDVPLRRKRDSPMEEDDCAPPALIRVKVCR